MFVQTRCLLSAIDFSSAQILGACAVSLQVHLTLLTIFIGPSNKKNFTVGSLPFPLTLKEATRGEANLITQTFQPHGNTQIQKQTLISLEMFKTLNPREKV